MAEDTKGYITYGKENGVSESKAKEYWEDASASVKKETGKTKDELSEADWKHIFGVFKSIITNSKKKETIDIVTTRKYIIEGNTIKENSKILLESNYLSKYIGTWVKVGSKRKGSIWTINSGLKKGKDVFILELTEMEYNKEPVFVVAVKEKYSNPDFDPEMDYELLYPDELQL